MRSPRGGPGHQRGQEAAVGQLGLPGVCRVTCGGEGSNPGRRRRSAEWNREREERERRESENRGRRELNHEKGGGKKWDGITLQTQEHSYTRTHVPKHTHKQASMVSWLALPPEII